MEYQISGDALRRIFPVPVQVVDEHLLLASPAALKTLLFLLRHTEQHPLSPDTIAQSLRMPKQDALDALLFWTDKGILLPVQSWAAVSDDAVRNNTSAMSSLPETAVASSGLHMNNASDDKAVPSPPSQAALYDDVSANDTPMLSSQSKPPQATTAASVVTLEHRQSPSGACITKKVRRPRIYAHEIPQLLQDDRRLALFLQDAQRIAGKDFSPLESECVLSLVLYFQFPPEVALMLVGYWRQQDKPTPRSLDVLAASWLDKGVDTLEKATRHLDTLARSKAWEDIVYQAFQIDGRRLTAPERDYCARWACLSLPQTLVALACEQTVLKIGKISFAYANKLLTEWVEQHIDTREQALAEMERNTQKYRRKNSPKEKKKNPSAHTSGSSLDDDELQAFLYQEYA